jgi:hypothetical protein
MAITPYLEYEELDEMREWVTDCEKEPPDELLACLTYDPKSDVP